MTDQQPPLTPEQAIETYHRMRPPADDAERATQAALLGVNPAVVTGNGAASEAGAEPDFVQRREWPRLATPALQGLAGEFVQLVAPESEAEPAALLMQFLVAFGNAVNRGAHCTVGGTPYYANLYSLIVGPTASGRKGSGWGRVRSFFELVDDAWARECITTGLSSGEGLIAAVRDATTKTIRVKQKDAPDRWDDQVDDPGVSDKRLLVVEEEFGGPLVRMRRDGSTLSPVVRQAWDGPPVLKVMTKSNTRATHAHISINAHITTTELQQELPPTEKANGFANRFLVVLTRRVRSLPEGGHPEPYALQDLARRVAQALYKARAAGELHRDDAARARWAAVYEQLSEGRPGLVGAVLGRAAPQVLRLSLVYALLDSARAIGLRHLEAALAVWAYCEASVKYVFGHEPDPDFDRLLAALHGQPRLTFTEVAKEVFQGHKSSKEIEAVVARLRSAGLADVEEEPTGGRKRRVLTLTTLSTPDHEKNSSGEDTYHTEEEASVERVISVETTLPAYRVESPLSAPPGVESVQSDQPAPGSGVVSGESVETPPLPDEPPWLASEDDDADLPL